MVASLVARNGNEVEMVPVMEISGVCVWRKSGVRRSFFVGVFGRNLVLVAVKMFSSLISSKNEFYKCGIFNAIRKDSAAINYITLQHEEYPFR
jgi:hypothetical protein